MIKITDADGKALFKVEDDATEPEALIKPSVEEEVKEDEEPLKENK